MEWIINLCFCHQIFHKRMPPEAVDLVSRLLQYSPNLRSTAVSIFKLCTWMFIPNYTVFYWLIYSFVELDWEMNGFECSWMHWHILSLKSYEIQMLAYLMDASFLHYSTLNLMVWNSWTEYKFIACSSMSNYLLKLYWFLPAELKGVPMETLVKLIPEHARKQCPFLTLWMMMRQTKTEQELKHHPIYPHGSHMLLLYIYIYLPRPLSLFLYSILSVPGFSSCVSLGFVRAVLGKCYQLKHSTLTGLYLWYPLL